MKAYNNLFLVMEILNWVGITFLVISIILGIFSIFSKKYIHKKIAIIFAVFGFIILGIIWAMSLVDYQVMI